MQLYIYNFFLFRRPGFLKWSDPSPRRGPSFPMLFCLDFLIFFFGGVTISTLESVCVCVFSVMCVWWWYNGVIFDCPRWVAIGGIWMATQRDAHPMVRAVLSRQWAGCFHWIQPSDQHCVQWNRIRRSACASHYDCKKKKNKRNLQISD